MICQVFFEGDIVEFSQEMILRACGGEMRLSARTENILARYAQALTQGEMKRLCAARKKAAENAGRVEFSGGIIDQLAEAFCDSCYVDAVNFCDTLEALLEAFYYYKSDMEDALTDEELIAAMRLMFDRCEGTLELVTGRELECMARRIRYGRGGIVDGAESGD